MSLFILITTLTFVICSVLAGLQFERLANGRYNIKLVRTVLFRLRLSRSQLMVRAFSLGIVATGALVVIIDRHLTLQDDLTGRVQAGHLVFGVLTGWMTSVLVRRAVVLGPKDELMDGRTKLSLALLALFFFLGIAGEEALRKLASAKLSPSGVEFTLTENARSSRLGDEGSPSLASSQAAAAGGTVSPRSSAGLGYFSSLEDFIARDVATAREIVLAADQKADFIVPSDLVQASEAAEVLRPFSMCLHQAYAATSDARFVEPYAGAVVRFMRSLSAPNLVDDRFARDTARDFERVAASLYRQLWTSVFDRGPASTSEEELAEACSKLRDQLCRPSASTTIATAKRARQLELRECMRNAVETPDAAVGQPSCEDDSSSLRCDVERALKAIVLPFDEGSGRPSHDARPYFRIGFASLLAHLGDREAALASLANWIDRHSLERKPANAVEAALARWQMIRARTLFNAYSEEHIRRLGPATPITMRTEHLSNLDKLLSDLRTLNVVLLVRSTSTPLARTLLGSQFTEAPEQDLATCTYNENAARALYTYYQNMANYVSNAIEHPDFKSIYSSRVKTYMQDLLESSLSCAGRKHNDNVARLTLRANILETYARWNLRSLDEDAENLDQRRSLRLALSAVDLAVQLIKRAQAAETLPRTSVTMTVFSAVERSPSYGERIAVRDTVDTEHSLGRTKDALKAAYRRLK